MKTKKLFILPLVVLLTSCGYDLKEVYAGDAYNNPIFEENYYDIYDYRIDKDNPNNTITSVKEVVPASFFTTYDELAESGLDKYVYNKTVNGKESHGFLYDADYKVDTSLIADFNDPNLDPSKKGYGPSYKLNRTDNIFSYGYISKLFDGNMFCNSLFQLSRVQLNEKGFGVIFDKEMVNNAPYLALNFKAAVNEKNGERIGPHLSDIKFTFSFYSKSGSSFSETKFIFDLDDVPTNPLEMHDNSAYTFLVLPLAEYNLSRVAGFSMSYELENDTVIDGAVDKDAYQYALMLYEIFLPNSSWR